jgi:hypothetical protein
VMILRVASGIWHLTLDILTSSKGRSDALGTVSFSYHGIQVI